MAEVQMEKSSIVISETDNAKEEKPEVKPVVKGKVSVKKKGVVKRVVDAFVGEDVGDVRSYLIYDVTIPAIKNLFYDVVTNGAGMMLFGSGARHRNNLDRRGGSTYVSYDSAYDRQRNREYARPNRRATHDFGDILFESRDDAEDVLDNLVDFIERYGQTTVGDLYDLIGRTAEFTDRSYGWRALGSSRVIRGRDGYILDLPPVEPLYK